MRRGEICLVDLAPVRGSEANKRPPGRAGEQRSRQRIGREVSPGVVTVVPVSSDVARVYPFQTLLPAEATRLRVTSKAQAEQVRSVSVERVGALVGRVPTGLLAELDDALRLRLQLWASTTIRR